MRRQIFLNTALLAIAGSCNIDDCQPPEEVTIQGGSHFSGTDYYEVGDRIYLDGGCALTL